MIATAQKPNQYEPISGHGHQRGVSSSVVHYVDETPGDHDVRHIQMSVPTSMLSTQQNILKEENEGGEEEEILNGETYEHDVHVAGAAQHEHAQNTLQTPGNEATNGDREHSFSAMSI